MSNRLSLLFLLCLTSFLAQLHGQELFEIVGFNRENRHIAYKYVVTRVGHSGESLDSLYPYYLRIESGASITRPHEISHFFINPEHPEPGYWRNLFKDSETDVPEPPPFAVLDGKEGTNSFLLNKPLMSSFVMERYETLKFEVLITDEQTNNSEDSDELEETDESLKIAFGFTLVDEDLNYITRPARVVERIIKVNQGFNFEIDLSEFRSSELATEKFNQLIHFYFEVELETTEDFTIYLSAPRLHRTNRGKLLVGGREQLIPSLYGNCGYEPCTKHDVKYCDEPSDSTSLDELVPRNVLHLYSDKRQGLLCGFSGISSSGDQAYLFGVHKTEGLAIIYASHGSFRVSIRIGRGREIDSEQIYSTIYPSTDDELITVVVERDRFRNNLDKSPISVELKHMSLMIDSNTDVGNVIITDIFLV
jgi:hypothetical protein